MVKTILSDFRGLGRASGWGVALRWLANIALHFPQCYRRRSLQPADVAMGPGPFRARLGRAEALVTGELVVGSIREMCVRDTYLGNGFLSIDDGATVVDLGANAGVFTTLALGHGPNVRVVAVEAQAHLCDLIRASLALNGWEGRARICGKFIGGRTAIQDRLVASAGDAASPFISDAEFLRDYGIRTVDFLKCDIEGSEFALLTPDSPLLAATRQLAIEVHHGRGNMDAFLQMLRDAGFEVLVWKRHTLDSIVLARRPVDGTAAAASPAPQSLLSH